MSIKATVARNPWILAALAFGVVVVWMLTGVFDEPSLVGENTQIKSTDDGGSGPMKVQVKRLYAEPVERFVTVYGRTAPARESAISAETEGRVEAINARRGEQLQAGAPMVTLDLRDRVARIKQAEASVREHATAYAAQSTLKSDGYVSDTQIAETLAKLEAARAELVRAQLDLENRIIRAPFDGVLQERTVEVGDFVRAGDQVATFVDNLTLIVTGTLAEQEVAAINRGEPATASLVTGQQVTGTVRYISPVADESTRTFLVELEVPNPGGRLPAGVTAEMQLAGGTVLAHRVSPAVLTLASDGTLGIMTVNDMQLATFVPVTIEKSESNGVWVSGLEEASQVIVVGQGFVSAGQEVEAVIVDTETALAAGQPL
ncbi:MAG: efflux RND transporter periplasmic adaptor subunit [Gammaproteobacteria bacterium]|jgi:multidrug efflux system membrane fusion protein|nr:efflux RND transporter periplasmic adaptor subunit [Gammaproteobacteria bacterium]